MMVEYINNVPNPRCCTGPYLCDRCRAAAGRPVQRRVSNESMLGLPDERWDDVYNSLSPLGKSQQEPVGAVANSSADQLGLPSWPW